MKRFGSRFISTSILAVAVSLLAVGVVWASSAASRIGDSPTVNVETPDEEEAPGDDVDVPEEMPGFDPIDDIEELRRQVVELSETVERLSSVIESLEDDVAGAVSRAEEAADDAGRIASVADDAAADAAEAKRVADGAAGKVGVLESRTSKLNEQGIYSGAINPSQLSRRLAPADLTGEWPLDRVTGRLSLNSLLGSSFGCSTDYRYHSILVATSFREVTCERILK